MTAAVNIALVSAQVLSGVSDGYLSRQKQAGDAPHEALLERLRALEGFIPVARRITNAEGVLEEHPTVGTGHYLSPDNRRKLEGIWGEDRYREIASGGSITPDEDNRAARHHLQHVVPGQLDRWNPNWRRLDPQLKNWLKTHAYALGDNLVKFEQAHNAVNASVFNPNPENLKKLEQEFRDSQFARQTGTRLDKAQPMFDAGMRRTLLDARRRQASAVPAPEPVRTAPEKPEPAPTPETIPAE